MDLALFGDRLSMSDQVDLTAAIDELTIPQRVHLLLYCMIDSTALRNEIETQGVEWYRRRDADSRDRPDRDAGAG